MKAVNVMYSMAYRIPQLASLSHLQSDDEGESSHIRLLYLETQRLVV